MIEKLKEYVFNKLHTEELRKALNFISFFCHEGRI